MKIGRNVDYSYTKNNISEDTGWRVWYDWKDVKKHIRVIGVCINLFCIASSFIFADILTIKGKANLLISVVSSLVIWLFIITPIHEILHFIPLSGLNLNDKCIITIGKGTVSALYNDKETKAKLCISTLLPLVVVTLLLIPFLIFSYAEFKVFFVLLMMLHIFGCYTDVYMFFYVMKNLKSTDTIFGRYYHRGE